MNGKMNIFLKTIFEDAHTTQVFSNQEVTKELIIQAWEQAKMAPTAFNAQPMRIDLIGPGQTRNQMVELMSPGNQDRVTTAPLVAVLSWDPQLGEVMKEYGVPETIAEIAQGNADSLGPQSATLQAAYFLLALRALGLGIGPMTGFDASATDKLLHQENGWRSMMVFCIGYPGEEPDYQRGPRPQWTQVAKEWNL